MNVLDGLFDIGVIMMNVKKILVFITFLAIFIMFTGAVSAANDTISQGNNISKVITDVSNHTIAINNGSTFKSAESTTTTSSAKTTGTTSSIRTTSTISSVQATSSDSTAPTVKSTSPSSGATGVSSTVTIKVTFSESVKLGTGSIVLKNSGGTSIPISKSVNGSILTVDPTNNLAGGKYTLTLSKGSITDLSGNNLSAYSFSFNVSNTVKNLNTNKTYSSIQSAVNAASSGNTIQVSTGIYTENVYIPKKITLKGSTTNAVIQALNTTLPAVRIISGGSGTTVMGFTIQGATNYTGLLVYNVTNCNIAGNIITGNGVNNDYSGIWLYYANSTNITGNTVKNNGLNGIEVDYTKNNKISGNTVKNNAANGILLIYSNNSNISGNNITTNANDGICLYYSNSTSINGNYAAYNNFGISLFNTKYNNITNNNATVNLVGILLSNSNSTLISGNNATSSNIGDISNPYGIGIDIQSSYNNIISGNNATDNMVHGILLYYANNNTLSGNTAANSNNGNGIYLNYANNNTLSKNTVTYNQYNGITVYHSNSNNLSGNKVTNSQYDGIHIESGNNNIISGNNVINNGLSGITVSGDNITINTGYDGIFLDNSNNTNITGNNMTDNRGCGLDIINSNNSTVFNNNLTNSGLNGISIYNSTHINISKNNAKYNSQFGIGLSYSDNNTLSGNNVTDNTQNGIDLLYSDNNILSRNNVTDNTLNGITVAYSDNNTLSGNNVTDNTQNGIGLAHAYNNVISGNNISNNHQNGIFLYYSSADIHFNRITGNSEYGLYNQGTDVIDATDNWWGSNNPTESSTTGSDIYAAIGTVIYDPWLVLTVNSSYLATGNAKITADLTHDNNGNDTSSSGTVPDGIPVDFNTTFGTIGATSYTNRGKATSELDSDATQNTATITTTLDNQDISLTVNLYPVYDLTTQKGFISIQAAINDSSTSNGDTIVIVSGTYTENIVLNKKLTLMPVTGGNVIIQASNSSSNVFTVNSGGSGSTIEGFTIKGSTRSYAIYLNYANNCNVTGNTITGNYRGIDLVYSNSTVISGNTITGNSNDGLCLDSSSNDVISGNNITGNSWNGINILYSNNNTISENNIINNANFGFYSSLSNNNILSKNIITNNNEGISLDRSTNDVISGNDISNNNEYGFYIYDSSASINFNRIFGNGNYGIRNNVGTINATNNWWGSDNPVVSSNIGSDIYNYGGTVTYDPYLVLTISSNEYDDGTSDVTADLTHDNSGNDTSSAGTVPDGIPVNFNTSFGTIGTTAYTSKGRAISALNSNSTHGTATVTAIADNQSASKTVNLMGIYDTTTNTGYSSIQDAINASSTYDGDIIEITNGTYTENIVINKRLNIISSDNATIQALDPSNPVITINSGGSGSVIQGFTIEGSNGLNVPGIHLDHANNCNIAGNIIISNYHGVTIDYSNNNTVYGNNITNNEGRGIYSYYSNSSIITGNTIENNGNCGIVLFNGDNITVTGNTIINNTNHGIWVYYSSANINFNRIAGNTGIGFFKMGSGDVNATNNWWGSNNPLESSNLLTCDISICGSGTVTYDPWLVLNTTISTTNSGGSTSVTADLTHNSNGDDTSSQGHVPDDTPVNFTTNTGTITRTAYTNYGKATTILNLGSTQTQTVTVAALLDNQNTNATAVVATGLAILNITSTAIDNSTGLPLNISYSLPLNESVSWLSVLWKNNGTFMEELQVIVNGTVVLDKYVYNNAYNTYKNSYREEVFEAIVYANQNLQYVSSDELTDFWSYVASNYGLNSTELAFVQEHRLEFVDNLTFNLSYPGVGGLNITVVDPENSTNVVNLNFVGGITTRTSQIIYDDGFSGDPAGYEGVRSFAIATTRVTTDILNYWLDQNSLYRPGAMRAAYGTFLSALLMEYVHDQVADQDASNRNITWGRTSPIIVSVGDEAYQTYITLECDHSMGMTAVGTPEDIVGFNYDCSLAISTIEYVVMSNLGLNYQSNSTFNGAFGSVMTDLGKKMLNGTALDVFEQNGFIIIKAVDDNDSMLIVDPETGIVRDINTVTGYCGAYCFHSSITDNGYHWGDSMSDEYDSSVNAVKDFFANHQTQIPIDIFNAFEVVGSYYGLYQSIPAADAVIVGSTGITLSLAFGVSGAIIGEGVLALNIRDHYIPKEYWKYISYHHSWPTTEVRTYIGSDNCIHYIEIPKDSDGTLKWDEAVYI